MSQSNKSLPALAVSIFLSITNLFASLAFNLFFIFVYIIGDALDNKVLTGRATMCMVVFAIMTLISLVAMILSIISINKHNKAKNNRILIFILLFLLIILLILNVFSFLFNGILGLLVFIILTIINFIDILLLIFEVRRKRNKIVKEDDIVNFTENLFKDEKGIKNKETKSTSKTEIIDVDVEK